MIKPTSNTELALQEAIRLAGEKHEIIELAGEYPITKTVLFRHPNRPSGFVGMQMLGAGPAWEIIEPMDIINWQGGALDWQAMSDGVILQADGNAFGFRGISFFGHPAFKVIGVDVPYLNGWGTGKHTFERCCFHKLDIGIRSGDYKNANCDVIRVRDCNFNNVKTAFQATNWQGVDHLIETSVFWMVNTIFDVIKGGKYVLRWPTLCNIDTLFHVHGTSYQLNTFIIDGASIDNAGQPPTFLINDARETLVRILVQNIHCGKTHTSNSLFNCNSRSEIEATVRSMHRVGKLCGGSGKITVILDACTLDKHSVPDWPGGLTSGVVKYNNGIYTSDLKLLY